MIRTFTRAALVLLSVSIAGTAGAQTTITQWNFNSAPPDGNTATGLTTPSTGSGTVTTIGGTTSTFASGSASGGSSDPAASDNSAWNVSTWPAQGSGNKTAGIQFAVSTSGYQDIQVTFDLRYSNTSPADVQLQYTADITAATPVWTDFQSSAATSGDTWFGRSFDLSAITALNNNPNAGFRAVAAFAGVSTAYAASNSSSSFSTSGTWRFDMLTVKGNTAGPTDVTPPVATLFKNTSATGSYIRFSEPLQPASAQNTANYSFNPALTVTSAVLSTSGDTVFLNHAALPDGQAYTLAASNVQDIAGNPMTAANFNVLYNGTTSGLVITEIAHSPNTIEFIEVYNASASGINLNGLKWTDGTTGNFPDMVLAAGANALFSTNPASASSLMGGTYYLLNNGLGSSNDVLVIRNTLDQVVDSVDYYDNLNGWPTSPGSVYGYSFELNDAANDNNTGSNWSVPTQIISSANGTIRATPGAYPPPPPSAAPQVLSYKQLSATASYVVFDQAMNPSSAATTSHYTFSPVLSVSAATPSATNDTVFLNHAATADGTPYTLTVTGVTNPSNAGNTPADLNFLWNQSVPQLVITEIIHSPNDIEMIEVYNAGPTAVNLGGLKWTDGTTGNFPAISLPADSTAVFATSPSTAAATLHIDTVYALNNGLSSSDDILVIRNSLEQVIDSVAYFVGTNGWPSAPAGVYAYSFELNDAANDNNSGSNWIVPFNTVSPQPAGGIVRATPGVYPPPAVTPGNASVSFVGSKANISENGLEVAIVANLTGGGSNPSSIDLELIPFGTAVQGSDFTLPADMQFNWPANANNVNDTIRIAINGDALPENTEYFVLQMVNPVNIDTPAVSGNNFTVFILDDDLQAPAASGNLTLNHLISVSNGAAGSNSAEIVAHDPVSQRLFIANSVGAKIDIMNFADPSSPVLLTSIPVTPYGNINSVAVKNGIVAAAIEDAIPENPGKVVFFDTNGVFISQVTVGAMPDMVTFNHAGTKVLTANEGQPNTAYTIDPEGSVSIVDISGGVAGISQANVTTADFAAYNSQIAALRSAGVRIFGPGSTVAQDMEPEYITVAEDDLTAWVTCQENNAIATIDLTAGTITEIRPLGTKDHMLSNNALDANDQGGVIQIANWPVKGIYMPDAIASFTSGGQTYLVTANEGDAREYDGYEETGRLGDAGYQLDSATFPYAAVIKANLGRLNITTASGDTDNDGDFDEIHAYGGRSVSIWNAATGALVWDSGDDMELMLSQHPVFSAIFNASNSNNTFKNRSDDKGPEPEGVTVATINNKVYAFIALERMGGCMVYDITNPAAPVFSDYQNTRTIASYGGDQGAEGIIYIKAEDAPGGTPIIILANEVSSTLSIYQVQDNTPLAIRLESISALNTNSRNRIDWSSASEDAGDVYELERSTDGGAFARIARIGARGTASSYTYWDEKPATGWNYYRLKTIALSGDAAYSKVVKAYQDDAAVFSVKAYPNPANALLTVSVNHFTEHARLELRDVNGKAVLQQVMQQSLQTLDISHLPAGIYFLRYKDNDHTKTIKINKY